MDGQDHGSIPSPGSAKTGTRFVAWLRGSRRRVTAVIVVAVIVVAGSVFIGKNLSGGTMTEHVREEEDKRLSQDEAYEFVLEHMDNVIASAKEVYKDYEKHGYLTIDSVEIIRDSVRESRLSKNPMVWSKGLILYNYYINGNPDYEVVADSIIGPNYEGTLIENISDPNVPGKVYGGATVSERFNKIMNVWDEEIYRPIRQARQARVAKEVAYIQAHKERVLEFARKRYAGDERVGPIDTIEIDPQTYEGSQYPEGVYVFDFWINGDKRFKISSCGMVGPDYPGTLRKRFDDGLPLRAVAEGFDGSSLKPGDIYEYRVGDVWCREWFWDD